MGRTIIVSNVIEYKNIKNVTGFHCLVKGESGTCYYKKQFRYSIDKILWSDYKDLTNNNLLGMYLNGGDFYIQYKFTQLGEGTLSVEKISLNVNYNEESTSVIPDCFWQETNSSTPQIVYSQNNNNLFNPYNVGSSLSIYNQMSTLVSNMFGVCVLYFKTEANSTSRDVVLKEYSIEHVIDKNSVKILIPDNQLPTKELQFNSMMIDYPVQFEVHIVKSTFQSVFGANSHPDTHDYLYFQTYMNKMYMVDSVSDPDDFGYTSSYWRVSLVPYQEMSSIKYDTEELQDETESLIFSAEGKFEEEIKEEFDDNRKDNQLNDLGMIEEGQDFLRRILNRNVYIGDEIIYNDWTVVSKEYYDLSTVPTGDVVSEYRYDKGFTNNDQRMFSFLFKPINVTKNIAEDISIKSIENNDGKVRLIMSDWNDDFLVKGNVVKLTRVSGLKNSYEILNVNKSNFYIDLDIEFASNYRIMSCARLNVMEANKMISVNNDGESVLSMQQLPGQMCLNLGSKKYFYEFGTKTEPFAFEDKWYAVILGLNKKISTMWLYEFKNMTGRVNNIHPKLQLVNKVGKETNSFDLGETCYYDLLGCNLKLTNFRLWNKLCEEELHNVILSQLVVDDTHNTLIVDNAQSELLLDYKWS